MHLTQVLLNRPGYCTISLMDDKNKGGDSTAGWQFKAENESVAQPSVAFSAAKTQPTEPLTSWTASEYIEHKKGFGWYLMLILGGILITAFLFWLTRDVVSSAIVIVLMVVFAVVANRKPRVLEYRLDRNGLAIGNKFYPYADFKSFTLEEVGPVKNLTFLPLKRFMPPISVYFAPQDEAKITNTLSQFLPYEQRSTDAVDRFMRSIRF
jgi:hypothetical protein